MSLTIHADHTAITVGVIGLVLGVSGCLVAFQPFLHTAWEQGRDAAIEGANPDKIPMRIYQHPNGRIEWFFVNTPAYIKRKECKK